MDWKEIEIYNEIQKTMETPWYKYFMEFIETEIKANEEVVIEWMIEDWNDIKYNYYDVVRSEIKYLKELRDRLEKMKKGMQDIGNSSVGSDI